MNYRLVPVFVLALGCGWAAQAVSQVRETRLPGARMVIEAVGFPSLQAAVDALPPEGGLVRLPPGVFDLPRPLRVRIGDVQVQGAGPATHLRNTGEPGQPTIVIAPPDGTPAATRIWRVQLSDFRVTGTDRSGHGILADRVNEVFIQGVTASNHGGDGIRLDNCYEDPRVSDCLITYNKGTGLNLIGCHDIVVAANQFEENQDAVRCTDGFNLCMTGNCVDDHLRHGVVIENTYGSVLSGNMIEECNGTAVILDRDCYGITVSANVIAHNAGGVDLRDAHGCSVSANTMTLMKADAVRIGPASGRITVAGNTFCNSYIGEGKIRRAATDLAAAGMTVDGAQDLAISGNVFSSVRPKALALQGDVKRIIFTENVVTDAPSDHSRLSDAPGSVVRDVVGTPPLP